LGRRLDRLREAKATGGAGKPGEMQPQAYEALAGPLRVRLTFDVQGQIEVTRAAFVPMAPDTTWTVRLAETRLNSADRLLRVKNT
ncbi:hypothetical protein ACC754_41235, partial [Rhizobium johnstonii]